ncbi:MAG: hypothetical protein A2Y34_17990 [Spirochaetes bacterium GWC1_27_15]|nr:MAG: hypothetical protein A2Z98_01640 [Spirochaetes bacterium GWB1_27_13]OHD22644.1 MAG: hypothetical protein A2Y34_17990 [Spirochaetes bacterium GWC1_27_15]
MIENIKKIARNYFFTIIKIFFVLLWVAVFNIIGRFTWGFGFQTFILIILISAVIISIPFIKKKYFPDIKNENKIVLIGLIVILSFFLVGLTIKTSVGIYKTFKANPGVIDIAGNTSMAGTIFLNGKNPYKHKSQLWHNLESGKNITVVNKQVKLYGINYYHGFPYFPFMFLFYLPFKFLANGDNSLRLANLILMILNIIGFGILCFRSKDIINAFVNFLMIVLLYLSINVYVTEVFAFGIVDILISTLALYAFIALHFKKYILFGVLMGLAQACKLLPAPLLILPVLVFLFFNNQKNILLKIIISYCITSFLFIFPFFIADPQAFISATVLFYLVNHSAGDNTAMWFFLANEVKPYFYVSGFLLSILIPFIFARRINSLPYLIAISFVSYLIFIGFAKMSHLNYLWGIYTIGCVSFGLLLNNEQPKDEIV